MYTFRLFDHASEDDYALLVHLSNQEDGETGLTVEEQRRWDEIQDPRFRYARFFIEKEGVVVGVVLWREPHWSYRPGKFFIDLIMPSETWDDAAAHAALDFILDQIQPMGPVQWVSACREDHPQKIALYKEYGFKQVMREPRSQLDVLAFDPSPYYPLLEKVREEGILILNELQLAERDPGYQQKCYDLEWEIQQDVPEPDGLTRRSFETWKKLREVPSFYPEGWFYAVAPDGRLVGQTSLWRSLGDPTILYTGLTGVVRAYRRKGIATALKVHAIAQAREAGALHIETDNEENNPMYQINLHLGFKPLPAYLHFEKKLES